jgi:hypothetical protein
MRLATLAIVTFAAALAIVGACSKASRKVLTSSSSISSPPTTTLYVGTVWGACEAWDAALRYQALLPLPVVGEPPPRPDLDLTESAIAQAQYAHDAALARALQAVHAIIAAPPRHAPNDKVRQYNAAADHATAICRARTRTSHP